MITTSTVVEIEAPIELVWQVITDVNAYHEWNPLIVTAHGESILGGEIDMLICPPGLMRRQAQVKVTALKPQQEFRWLGRWGLPRILDGDHAFLVQALSQTRTQVTQTEAFSGILARPLSRLIIPRMTEGFDAMNHALKIRCET